VPQNAIFPKAREAFATKLLDWVDDPIDLLFFDLNDVTGGVIDLNAVTFLGDIPLINSANTGVIATFALPGKTADLGVLDADDFTVPGVAGDQFETLLICTHTGNASTSRLLIYIDDATGLPTIPNTGDIRIQWPTDGIATL
jgi:hypothetical protein